MSRTTTVVTVTPCVVSVEEMMFVTVWLVTALMDVNNTGLEQSVTVRNNVASKDHVEQTDVNLIIL